MGTSLTGLTPATTYDALIKVGDNGPLSATAKYLSDGLGNDSPMSMSTTKVGINTSTPDANLHISGDASNRAVLRLASTAANRLAAVTFYGNNVESATIGYEGGSEIVGGGVQGDLIIRNVLAGKDIILDTNAGNVGIGTTTPGVKLTVVGTGEYDGLIHVRSTGSGTPIAVLGVDAVGSGVGYVGSVNNIPFQIRTNDVTRLRVDADGLKFGSDTAAANALDDYEEGTWTPVFSGTTFSGTIAATYTKIGRLVTVQMNFVNQTLASSAGAASISGLPFTCNSATFGIVSFTFCDAVSASVASGYVGVSGTAIQIRTNTGINDTSFVDGTSNRSMMLTATYFV